MSRRSRLTTALAVATACTTSLVAFQPAFAAGPRAQDAGHVTAVPGHHGPGQKPGQGKRQSSSTFDARRATTGAEKRAMAKAEATLQAKPDVRRLSDQLGSQSVIDMDAQTGTPRQVSRLNGLLTGPSSASAQQVALGFVRQHQDVFGLSDADLSLLQLSRDYVDITGIHHLSFTQQVNGVPVFGNGLKANVTKDGRLVNVSGSPIRHVESQAPADLRGGLGLDQAIRIAKSDTGEAQVAPAKRDVAERVLFHTSAGLRAAVKTVTMSASDPTLDVIDAETGRILYRDHLSADLQSATSDVAAKGHDERDGRGHGKRALANVFDWYPHAPGRGGRMHVVNLNKHGWLPRGSVVLFGNNVHTYNDVNDNNAPDSDEEVSATGKQGFRFPLKRTYVQDEPCTSWVCTWHPDQPYSWQANASRTATQNFYFINNWHDYLEKAPIGFTEAAGNFQQVNRSGEGLGGDPVHDESLDGADTNNGLPDLGHIDNANFATPPDGVSPTMQMYLWHAPGFPFSVDPFIASMGSDEADIVYHEYTHGLSHRLVTDASNNPALDSVQGGSMGEAWSDWYAEDYLVNQGLMKDTRKPGEIKLGTYVGAGKNIRSEPTDCPVGRAPTVCPGTKGTDAGGYTYGDFGRIFDATGDVHAAGEIWAQTLWDLRAKIGPRLAESVVTRGMELSPTYPSYLDMRNAILQADEAVYGGRHVRKIWRVFAHRGMGFFAATTSGNDLHPVEDFSMPPAKNTPRGTVTGTVTDQNTGQPVPGVSIAFGGHSSGFPGDYSATTGADGTYAITGVLPGTYPDVFATGAGYDPESATVTVGSGTTTRDWQLRRDWAASSGGASVIDFNGPDYTMYGCGPSKMIDQSLGQGWGSDAGPAKYVVVKLPKAVDVSELAIDPSNTCGDGPEAATAGFSVETSPDGTTWTTAATGTFGPDDLGRLNPVDLTAGSSGVQYVRYSMLNPQGGASVPFLDSSELEVYGAPSAG